MSDREYSEDDYDGIEPMNRISQPSSVISTSRASAGAIKNRILRRKKKTLDERLTELTDYKKKLEDINDAVLLVQQATLLLHKVILILSNHD
jgi:hypothetical protein